MDFATACFITKNIFLEVNGMKLQVIGYYGAYPAPETATSSYLLQGKDATVLLDCGSGALSRLQKYIKVTDLDGVILSHYHHDHMADVGPLQYACLVQNGINQTNNVLPIYGHDEDKDSFSKLNHNATKGVTYSAKSPLQIGSLTFTFFKTVHPVPCFGMRMTNGQQTIVYTADTQYFDELPKFCEGADLLISDCSFYEGMDGSGPGHMTSEECGKLAAKANVKELWLSHLPHFGSHENLLKEAKQYFHGPIKLAKEGLTFGAS